MNKSVFTLAVLLLLASCKPVEDSADKAVLLPPSDVSVEREGGAAAVIISWTDNSDGEIGFSVFKRTDAAQDPEFVGMTVADATSFTLRKGLELDADYSFGVRADANPNSGTNSGIVWAEPFYMKDFNAPSVTVSDNITVTGVSVALRYSFNNMDLKSAEECGICWNIEDAPTVDDDLQGGPLPVSESEVMMQVISNVLLDYGQTYSFRAYLKSGGKTYYSNEVRAALGAEPEAITLAWTKLPASGMPSSIGVYSFSGQMNGDPLDAWYATADLGKGDVELRVLMPESLKTIDDQAAAESDCCILTNAGYFYNTSHVGVAVINSAQQGFIPDMRGSLRPSDAEYNEMYHATRGIFGITEDAKPGVYWTGGTSSYYYDRPLPSVRGEAKYPACSNTFPSKAVNWNPKYAVSGGPVLLFDGKCPLDFTPTDKGGENWLNNFEIVPYDICGPDVTPDRTAVGFTEDGKVVLLICDGRTAKSGGATLTELAMIMKGLGCVSALNLDGGGSTGMMVGNTHVNDHVTGGNRAVKSTIGFFRK